MPKTDKQKSSRAFLYGVIGCCILLSALLCVLLTLAFGKTPRSKLIANAKDAVLKNIATPASAKFPQDAEFSIERDLSREFFGKPLWNVHGYVDAQNHYGAMLRKKFVVTFRVVDGQKTIEPLEGAECAVYGVEIEP